MKPPRANMAGQLAPTAATGNRGMPVPRHACGDCGEFLPHACAPVITTLREKWTEIGRAHV